MSIQVSEADKLRKYRKVKLERNGPNGKIQAIGKTVKDGILLRQRDADLFNQQQYNHSFYLQEEGVDLQIVPVEVKNNMGGHVRWENRIIEKGRPNPYEPEEKPEIIELGGSNDVTDDPVNQQGPEDVAETSDEAPEVDLGDLSRAELNILAEEAGVEKPQNYKSKAAIIEAIEEAKKGGDE